MTKVRPLESKSSVTAFDDSSREIVEKAIKDLGYTPFVQTVKSKELCEANRVKRPYARHMACHPMTMKDWFETTSSKTLVQDPQTSPALSKKRESRRRERESKGVWWEGRVLYGFRWHSALSGCSTSQSSIAPRSICHLIAKFRC